MIRISIMRLKLLVRCSRATEPRPLSMIRISIMRLKRGFLVEDWFGKKTINDKNLNYEIETARRRPKRCRVGVWLSMIRISIMRLKRCPCQDNERYCHARLPPINDKNLNYEIETLYKRQERGHDVVIYQ